MSRHILEWRGGVWWFCRTCNLFIRAACPCCEPEAHHKMLREAEHYLATQERQAVKDTLRGMEGQ